MSHQATESIALPTGEQTPIRNTSHSRASSCPTKTRSPSTTFGYSTRKIFEPNTITTFGYKYDSPSSIGKGVKHKIPQSKRSEIIDKSKLDIPGYWYDPNDDASKPSSSTHVFSKSARPTIGKENTSAPSPTTYFVTESSSTLRNSTPQKISMCGKLADKNIYYSKFLSKTSQNNTPGFVYDPKLEKVSPSSPAFSFGTSNRSSLFNGAEYDSKTDRDSIANDLASVSGFYTHAISTMNRVLHASGKSAYTVPIQHHKFLFDSPAFSIGTSKRTSIEHSSDTSSALYLPDTHSISSQTHSPAFSFPKSARSKIEMHSEAPPPGTYHPQSTKTFTDKNIVLLGREKEADQTLFSNPRMLRYMYPLQVEENKCVFSPGPTKYTIPSIVLQEGPKYSFSMSARSSSSPNYKSQKETAVADLTPKHNFLSTMKKTPIFSISKENRKLHQVKIDDREMLHPKLNGSSRFISRSVSIGPKPSSPKFKREGITSSHFLINPSNPGVGAYNLQTSPVKSNSSPKRVQTAVRFGGLS